ncbi:hypothetical protein CORT_0B01790 [Candida orthopsilosis Co 90-125]|uniref:Uncharacterized protein n=1 Tax=Candida orthopsilosis (strain 90-125) TaxID=1136231 RepID=H8X0K8_CANO9|nr:hypothetical protein CORT_0B01790 [Candida orthopsilosis Co 90-125]CCG21897.1 hypothetical protein CORT_0B01790 [Candida orthopsilosis Co 90-125]
MKVHKLLFLSSTVAAIAVNNGCAKNETDRVGANGSDKMKIKHSFSFPIFKFKLKLPFQNTDPGSLPPGQVGSVEEAEKSSSIDKEWKFQPDVTEDATQPSEYKEDANDNDGCDGSDKEEPSSPSALPFKGFSDMFMEMMNVGKDLTLEKIEVLKDILFLIDRIKEQSREENTPENEKVDSDTPEHANVDENSTNSAENGNLSPSIATQGSSDAKIDVWRFSTDRGMIGQLSKRHDISPEDLNNMIKLGDLKRFLKKNKSKGNKADENEHDTVVDKQYDGLEGSLVKLEDEEKEVEAEDEDAKFDLTDLSKLKEKLSMSGKANDEGDTTSKLKNIFKKGGDKKKQTDQQEKEGGSSKIKSHFKKDSTLVISTLVTTITTVVNSETQTPEEDCPEDKNQSKPKLYPYLHPKGEEYPEGLYDGDLVSEKEECEDDESINVPLNLREKTTLKVLGVKEKEKAGEKTQIDKLSFVKRDGKEQVESEFTDKESTPTAGEFEDSDDSDYDDDGNDDKLEKKKSRWSWSSIFGFGKNRKEEEPSPDEPKFESTWLFKNKLRLKKGKSKPVPTITTTTVLNTSRPTDDGTENEEEDDPDCPKEKKERLRRENEEKLRKKKEALKNEKKVLKEKLKKVPKSSSKGAPKKVASTGSGFGKLLTPSTVETIFESPSLKLKPVQGATTPISSVTSEKRKNLLLLIPDEGDAKLLTPEEFASAASDFDQALIVKVAYKTVQTAYKIAKEKQSDISNDTTEGTDVDEADELTTREHVMKQKQSVEKAFKNRKTIEETVSTFFGGSNGAVNSSGASYDEDIANDKEKSIDDFKFGDYDSFEAHNATPSDDLEVDEGIARVFDSLKQSGLINNILILSLKDQLVRNSLMDLTIENLKNNQISWDEWLMAIQAHGLDIDVDKFTFAKPEIGKLLSKSVLDAIPVLIQKGFLTRLDVIQELSFGEGQLDRENSIAETNESEEGEEVHLGDVKHESRHAKSEKGHLEKHHSSRNFNSTTDHTVEHHEEENKKFEKEDHVKHLLGQDFKKDGHENIYNDAKTEYSEILKDEEGVYKKNSKNEALQHHKEKYREKNKSGEFKEERIESDRHEQKKEKLEQDFQLGNSKGNLDKRHEIVRSEESIHKKVTEKHQFDLSEQFEDGTNKSNKERHKEDESSFIKNHHELNHHEEDHQNVDYVKDLHELDQTVKEKEHHKDYFRDLNHKKRHAIDHNEDDNHKEITEHHKSDFKEHSNDGSNKHTMQVHNEDNFQVVKDEHELNHDEQNHGDAESSKDVHNLDQFITEKEHHKKYEKNTNHGVSLHLTRRDELNQHDNLIIDKGLKSSNTFANDRAKDHYESSRTLGGQLHSKEHYAKEHHEKERHETAPGVEQYEKENHDKEEHAKENPELGPQEHEQVFKEHGKVGNKLASSNDASVEKESRLNMKSNGPLQITPPVSVQVVLPVIG